jgi:hypothetical protein
MSKVKFKQDEKGVTIAYVDATKKAKGLFDDVKRAYLVLGKYYQGISGPINDWKRSMKDRCARRESSPDIIVDDDGFYIEFESGKVTQFTTSEYCKIHALEKMAEF